jgi:hypothetical protein
MFDAGDLRVTHSSLINCQNGSLINSESGVLVGHLDVVNPMIIATDVECIGFANIGTYNRIKYWPGTKSGTIYTSNYHVYTKVHTSVPRRCIQAADRGLTVNFGIRATLYSKIIRWSCIFVSNWIEQEGKDLQSTKIRSCIDQYELVTMRNKRGLQIRNDQKAAIIF